MIKDDFCEYIQKFGKINPPSSEYQILNIDINNSSILIYQSGIVILEKNPKIEEIINIFYNRHKLQQPEFETYIEKNYNEKTNIQNQINIPKGIWLTELQISALIEYLNANSKSIQPIRNERARFEQNDQVLIVNKNNVVYTTTGFDDYHNIISKVVKNNNPYLDFDNIIIFDEIGRWDKIGPYIVSLSQISPNNAIELQIKGVKDHSITRNKSVQDFLPIIENYVTYETKIVTPYDINSQIQNKTDYLTYLNHSNNHFISSLKLSLNKKTLLIIDSELSHLIDHTNTIKISKKYRDLPIIGISSTINHIISNKWKNNVEKQSNIKLTKDNISALFKHKEQKQLIKEFLFND